jgi:hypothetical protein
MTSPYSSGGGGTHFEARVVASCVAAVISEGPVRGLIGELRHRLKPTVRQVPARTQFDSF